jgi:hypothetical protein
MIYNNDDKYNGEWINAIFINGIIQYNNGDEFKAKIENNKKVGILKDFEIKYNVLNKDISNIKI